MLIILSGWAAGHLLASRILFAFSLLLLNALALLTAGMLSAWGYAAPSSVLYLMCIPAIAAFYFYPKRSEQPAKATYGQRKRWDLLLFMLTFFMVAGIAMPTGGSKMPVGKFGNPVLAATRHTNAQKQVHTDKGSRLHQVGQLFHKMGQRLTEKVARFRAWATDMTQGERVLGIILVVFASLGLIYLLASIACGIACSGLEVLAIGIFIVGLAAIIFFAIRTIRFFYRGKRAPGKLF